MTYLTCPSSSLIVDVLASMGVFDASSYISMSFMRSIWKSLTISKLTYSDSGIMVLKRMMNDVRIGKNATLASVRYQEFSSVFSCHIWYATVLKMASTMTKMTRITTTLFTMAWRAGWKKSVSQFDKKRGFKMVNYIQL